MDMEEYRKKRNLVVTLVIVWFVLFLLQGAGIFGASVNPVIMGLPFSIVYLLIMGIWGVVNAVLAVKLLSPFFYKKAEAVLKGVDE
jgi:hypothetical protein